MTHIMFRRGLAAVIAVSVASSSTLAMAANWADALFPVKTHDFGTVAVAAKTEFVFPIRNTTNQDIHISHVRASCGCTTPILKEQWIKKGEEGNLTARFNTDSFWGKKGATLTVVIDQPQYTEVQLRVDGYIRRDMVVNPGSVDFGKVTAGETVEKRVSVAYAGRGDWQILAIESPRSYVTTEVIQKNRSGTRVDYELVVKMTEGASLGFLRDELVLQTNDRSMPRVPLLMTAQVESQLTVAPATISLATMKPGEDKSMRLIVTGKTPFKVTEIVCEGFTIDFDESTEAKMVQIVNIRLAATNNVGEIKQPLIVKTDGGDDMTAESLVVGVVTDR
jgi:hypothetical protein